MFGFVALAAFVALIFGRRSFVAHRFFLRTFVAMLAIDVIPIVADTLAPTSAEIVGRVAMVAIWVPLAVALCVGYPQMLAWKRDAERDTMVLAPPFEGSWRVEAGGAWPGTNHHQIASDQRFAYDFVRLDGPSAGSPILAPIAGKVVACNDGAPDHPPSRRVIEDANPFGNFVAIKNERGTVLLVHLRCGSVRVSVGDEVMVSHQVGECGNSGRTTMPHLHLHAQIEIEPAPFTATGIPVAFKNGAAPKILGFGDRLTTVNA